MSRDVKSIFVEESKKLKPIIEIAKTQDGNYREFLFNNGQIKVVKEGEFGSSDYFNLHIFNNDNNENEKKHRAQITLGVLRGEIEYLYYMGVVKKADSDYDRYFNLARFANSSLRFTGPMYYQDGPQLWEDDELGDSLVDRN